VSVRQAAVRALAERYAPTTRRNPACRTWKDETPTNPRELPIPAEERDEGCCMTVFIAGDGVASIRALTYREVVDALVDAGILPDD